MNIKNTSLCDKANQITLTILTYGHAKISTNWKGDSINREFSFLYYIHKGEGIIKTESKTVRLTPGNWYLIPSGCNFEYYCEEYMENIYFHIHLSKADRLDTFRQLKNPLCVPSESTPWDLFELVKDSCDLISILTVKDYIYKTVLRILKENDIKIDQPFMSECVLNAIKYISLNPTASLTSTEIAKNSFVSKSKLTKQFRKELSMSIQEYLYSILLSEAARLLANTSLSISEISERLGFSDQFYFSRKFKQKYASSPRTYRNRIGHL